MLSGAYVQTALKSGWTRKRRKENELPVLGGLAVKLPYEKLFKLADLVLVSGDNILVGTFNLLESMNLQFPIKPDYRNGIILLTQGFGENLVPFYAQMGLKGHNGLDFSVDQWQDGNAPILNAFDAFVVSDKTVQSDTKGRFVTTLSPEVVMDNKSCKVEGVYFHLKEARVSVTDSFDRPWFYFWKGKPQFLKAGELIGISDNTGQYTTGSHLHFGIRIHWKQPDGTFLADYSNGYQGFVDPLPYFNDNQVYQLHSDNISRKFFYNGKQITRQEVDLILNA